MVQGSHLRSPEALSVFRTGALLLCQPSEMVRVGRIALPSSSFQARPSAADITPCDFGARGRTLTLIFGVRSAALFGLSYASNCNWLLRLDSHQHLSA